MKATPLDWRKALTEALERDLTAPELAREVGRRVSEVHSASRRIGIKLRLTAGHEGRHEKRLATLARIAEEEAKNGPRKSASKPKDGLSLPSYHGPEDHPQLPKRLPSGAYDPDSLMRFIRECEVRRFRPDQIAALLRVQVHRIVYIMGQGREVFLKKAKRF